MKKRSSVTWIHFKKKLTSFHLKIRDGQIKSKRKQYAKIIKH